MRHPECAATGILSGIAVFKWPVVLLAMSLFAGDLHAVFGNMEDEDWWYLDGGASGAVNASWLMEKSLIVGRYSGDSSLYVGGNGTVFDSGSATIGDAPAATGRVTVASGAKWVTGIILGLGGKGYVTLYGHLNEPGAGLACVIGGASGSYGELFASGDDAALYFGETYVGGQGEGRLSVFSGAVAELGSLTLGLNDSSAGEVEVALAGSTLTTLYSEIDAEVGRYGSGRLTVRDGASLTSASGMMYVARFSESEGAVVVSGAESELDSALAVGYMGKGSLDVEGGARVGELRSIGHFERAEGSVELKGEGSRALLDASWPLDIGKQGGTGRLVLSGGASLGPTGNQAGEIWMGPHASVLLTGAGTTLTMGRGLSIGNDGDHAWGESTSAFLVEDGAGFLRVNNGNAAEIIIGNTCAGSVEVRGQGSAFTVACPQSFAYLGRYSGGVGRMLVEDRGAVSIAGIAVIGMNNDNKTSDISTLRIRSQGTFSGGTTYIGLGADYTSALGLGIVKAEGAGSEFLNSGPLFVGFHGTGMLNLSGGALATSSTGWIGNRATGTGVVNVFGLSEWDVGGVLNIGAAGRGTLNIKNGGLVESGGRVTVGLGTSSDNNTNAEAVGSARVAGEGSLLRAKADLAVGGTANGALTISDGGLVAVSGTLGTGERGVISLAGGWLAIESSEPVTALALVSDLHLQYYDGAAMVPAGAEDVEVIRYDGVTRLWQAGDELFDIYGGKIDLTGYTVARAGVSDVGFANAGDGWNHSLWYGWFYTRDDFAGWIYHQFHGWQYVYEGSVDASSYVWDAATASWWWTAWQCYPFFYRYEGAKWHCYDKGTTPGRSFWVYDGAWSQVAESEM